VIEILFTIINGVLVIVPFLIGILILVLVIRKCLGVVIARIKKALKK